MPPAAIRSYAIIAERKPETGSEKDTMNWHMLSNYRVVFKEV